MTAQVVAFNKPLDALVIEIRGRVHDAGRAETTCAKHQLQAGLRLLELRSRIEGGEAGEVSWWDWYETQFTGYIKSRKYAERLMKWARADDPDAAREADIEKENDRQRAARQETDDLEPTGSNDDQPDTDIVDKALRLVAKMTTNEREQFHSQYMEQYQ